MSVKLGPLTFLFWVFALVDTAALVFLGIMTWEEVQVPFFLFFVVPALFTLAFTRLGVTRESVFSPVPFVMICVSFIVLWLNVLFLNAVFGYSVQGYSVTQQVTGFDHLLIAALYAVYEETLFLSVAALLMGGGFPDMYAILAADIVFIGLHALRYPATMFYDLFLLVGRSVMTGALVYTKNSDVPYAVHVLYNITASLGGG